MSNLSASELLAQFGPGAKVVISPDKMRAWVSLPKPPKGGGYTAEAIRAWLPEHGVVFGADNELIRRAVAAQKWDDLLEVARGEQPVAAQGGDYRLLIEKRPFTGLSAVGDGALVYDDFSFLQEVPAGQPLAELVPAVSPRDGTTVTGENIPPRGGGGGRELSGSGYALTEDGHGCYAPVLSHVNIVNDQLVLTPLLKLAEVAAEEAVEFDGNVLVEGDVSAGSSISASGSVFVAGRTVSARIKAGNNVLLAKGMRSEAGFGTVEAGGNVWGQFFESCNIRAGGDLCANHLTGCEAVAEGRANILGGTGTVARSSLYAKGGVVAVTLGDHSGAETRVQAGMDAGLQDKFSALEKKADRLSIDIQALQQNITTHERVNRMKPDKGRGDEAYRDMVTKRDQSLSILKILDSERTRLRRTMDSFSNISIVVRNVALPGVLIIIDGRSMKLTMPMKRTKFRRVQDVVEAVAAGQR